MRNKGYKGIPTHSLIPAPTRQIPTPPPYQTNYKSLIRGKRRLWKCGPFSWPMPSFWLGDAFRCFLGATNNYFYYYPSQRAASLQTRFGVFMTTTQRVVWGLKNMCLLERQKHWAVFLVPWPSESRLCALFGVILLTEIKAPSFAQAEISRFASLLGRTFPHFWTHKP